MTTFLNNLEIVGALVTAAALIWGGVAKAVRPADTAIALKNFRITRGPNRHAAILAGMVEGAVGSAVLVSVALAADTLLPFALLVASCLFALFAKLVGTSLLRGEAFPCMCFGSTKTTVSLLILLRAGFFFAVCAMTFGISFGGSIQAVPFATRLLITCCVTGALAVVTLTSGLPAIARRVDPFFTATDQLVSPNLNGDTAI